MGYKKFLRRFIATFYDHLNRLKSITCSKLREEKLSIFEHDATEVKLHWLAGERTGTADYPNRIVGPGAPVGPARRIVHTMCSNYIAVSLDNSQTGPHYILRFSLLHSCNKISR